MTDCSKAKEEILPRIRSANRSASGTSAFEAPEIAWQALPRCYTREGHLPLEGWLRLFEERLIDYGAHVHRVRTEDLAREIERILTNRKKGNRILAPAGLPLEWLPTSLHFHPDDGIAASGLDKYETVLTSATLAIAVTGTIIPQNHLGKGRRSLSLVPDYHLCIVFAEQVVETVLEAFDRLGRYQRASNNVHFRSFRHNGY